MVYYSNWKELIVKAEKVDYICFKFNFKGGYYLKAMKNGYFIPIVGDDIIIQIPGCELYDALDFLKSQGYKIHEHSVVRY